MKSLEERLKYVNGTLEVGFRDGAWHSSLTCRNDVYYGEGSSLEGAIEAAFLAIRHEYIVSLDGTRHGFRVTGASDKHRIYSSDTLKVTIVEKRSTATYAIDLDKAWEVYSGAIEVPKSCGRNAQEAYDVFVKHVQGHISGLTTGFGL